MLIQRINAQPSTNAPTSGGISRITKSPALQQPAQPIQPVQITPNQKKVDLNKIGTDIVSTAKFVGSTIISGMKITLGEAQKAIKTISTKPTTQQVFSKENVVKSFKETVKEIPIVKLGKATIDQTKFNVDLVKGILSEYKAEGERMGGQNFEAKPEVKFTPKNKAQELGVVGYGLLKDLYAMEAGGINTAFSGAIGSVTNTPRFQFVSSVVKQLASKKLVQFMDKLKPIKLTFEDALAVNTNKATTEQLIRYQQAMKFSEESGIKIQDIIARSNKVDPKTKVYDFLKSSIDSIKNSLKSSLTKEEQKLLESGIKKEVIPAGEYTSQEAIGKVISNGLEKTPEGKQIVKLAVEAQQGGKNLIVESVVKQPKFEDVATAKNAGKLSTDEANLLSPSGERFLTQQSSSVIPKVMNTDELLKHVTERGGGYRTPEQIATLRKSIEESGIKYPVELVINKDGSISINDGIHRIQIAKDLGIKEIPVKVVKNEQLPQINAKQEVGGGVVKEAQKVETPKVGERVKPSGVAKQIEAKAIEKSMIDKGYNELAQYDSSTIKVQSKEATKYSIDEINKIATGETPLPKELKPGTPLSIAEDYAIKNNDTELLRKLANSPLATQISESASELSLSRMRNQNSPVNIMKDIIKAREKSFEKKYNGRKVKDVVKNEVEKIKKEIKVIDKYDWNHFIDSIETCK